MITDIILGIKDYIKDCYHDWWIRQFEKRKKWITWDAEWKEGSVRHYIYNRKVGRQRKGKK